jgi:hypothetical protein
MVPNTLEHKINPVTRVYLEFKIRIKVGANFWIDKKKKRGIHFIFRVISGIQKCIGAIPLLIDTLIIKSVGIIKLILIILSSFIFILIERRMMIELKVWIIKYFIISSLFLFLSKITMKAKDLSSKNAHIMIQFDLVITPKGAIINTNHLIIYKKSNFQ